MRHVLAGFGAIALATATVLSVASTARAECSYLPDYPPITAAMRSATEIIVGEVVERLDDSPGDFRLRINHVLRGGARVGDVRHIEYLYPKWPTITPSDGAVLESCTYLAARKGDLIAIAFGALANDGRTRYNAAGWLKGVPRYWGGNVYAERTTLAKLEALAALPQSDSEPFAREQAVTELPWLPLIAGGLAGLFVLVRRPGKPG